MGFLAEILRANRAAVRSAHYTDGLPPRGSSTRPSLRRAIEERRAEGSILAEFKRVSPGRSQPRLPQGSVSEFVRDLDGSDIVGYSCLATRPRFDGAPQDVLELTRATTRPVLFKDFVVGERQLEAAERAGASAVLLIARLARPGYLDRSLSELADAAHDRKLEVLLEFHARAELSEAEDVAADMYGVNVRDLDTLCIDRRTAMTTLRAARGAGFSPLIGLSGISTPSDARRFWSEGVDAILVGTAVARASRRAEFIASLRRASLRSSR